MEKYEDIQLNNIDEKDFDKHLIEAKQPSVRSKPKSDFELTPNPIDNQGSLGSCVGFSLKGTLSYFFKDELSALWIYKKAKKFDMWKGEDYEGTSISGACIALKKKGVCKEHFYPYPVGPKSPIADSDAKQRKIGAFRTIKSSDLTAIQDILIEKQRPLPFSINVHKNFYSAYKDGFIKEDGYLESEKRGGHAMAIVGWITKDGKIYLKARNSWGESWGDSGHCYISFDLFKKISKGIYLVYKADEEAPAKATMFTLWLRTFNKVVYFFKSLFGLK